MISLDEYNKYIARLRRGGETLAEYECPTCEGANYSRIPPPGDTFDTLAGCPHCLAYHFRVVHSDGFVKATATEV